jgi:SAM-dependent methyltransferase
MRKRDIDICFYLKVLDEVLPGVLNTQERFDSPEIVSYYNKMGKLYKKYHSDEGAMHFPVKTNEFERHNEKLLYQALSVSQLIKTHSYTKIVELGCGFGFNSIFLARLFPNVQFIATDINEHNLNKAKRKAKLLHNLTFIRMNFNDPFPEFSCDVVFGVETLCYAERIKDVLKNISSNLNSNGRIVLFDCYEANQSTYAKLNTYESIAYKLVCWGWALKKFPAIQEVYSGAEECNLSVENEQDLTQNIISNYRVLQGTCKRIFQFPLIVRVCLKLKLLNRFLFMHIVNGLFGTYFIENQHLKYYHLILKKK